ncbi:MAG: hypothetical protein KAG61_07845 [Bacteriovoracaceae bacterium]|nr:hypothetical protein [Bacteriovoracaceae bacterium]
MTRYSPIEKGPLSSISTGSGNTVADTFRSSSYFETVLDEPLKVYRVYGGEAGELGRYWSRVKPTGPGQATFDAALLPSFRNSSQKVAEINDAGQLRVFKVKESVSGYAGKVEGGSGYQFFIPNDVPLVDVIEEIILD